jgi:hypothetical protein
MSNKLLELLALQVANFEKIWHLLETILVTAGIPKVLWD